MHLGAILTLGFFLGMRHATDADHVVAVTTIVARARSLRAAAPIGVLWGIGHTVTILVVGGGIILLGVVIPPRVGLGMELSVAFMLVALGALNVRSVLAETGALAHRHADPAAPLAPGETSHAPSTRRPLFVGIVHGLAGSAAVALLVLGTVGDALSGLAYLLVFGVGTIAGMLLVTTALAVPVAAVAGRFERVHRVLGIVTGVASVLFGAVLVYEIGFVDGLFMGQPHWSPR